MNLLDAIRFRSVAAAVLVIATVLLFASCPHVRGKRCGCKGHGVTVDPADFVAAVTNPFFPLTPGTTYYYEAETEDGTEEIEVTVLEETIEILGVTCTIVHDVVSRGGSVIEDTHDWYAQDIDGNVWYFGEASMEMEDGIVTSTFGSWKAGVHCAEPGIVMEASPMVDDTYSQEFYACVAEDKASVLALGESVSVAYGDFDGCLRTFEFTPLESATAEKLYAPGIGHILTFDDGERAEELVSISVKRQ